MHLELVRTFSLNEVSSKYAALSEPKILQKTCLFMWSFNQGGIQDSRLLVISEGKNRESMQSVWKSKIFHLKPIISEKHSGDSGCVPMPTEDNADTTKAAMQQLPPSERNAHKSCTCIIPSAAQSTTFRSCCIQKLKVWGGMGLCRGNWQFTTGLSLTVKL